MRNTHPSLPSEGTSHCEHEQRKRKEQKGSRWVIFILSVLFFQPEQSTSITIGREGWACTLHSHPNNCSISRGWEMQRVKEIQSLWKRYCPWNDGCNDVCLWDKTYLEGYCNSRNPDTAMHWQKDNCAKMVQLRALCWGVSRYPTATQWPL